jgi:hypothetical protein
VTFKLSSNSRLRTHLGEAGVDFLEYGLGGLTRILPHVEATDWKIQETESSSVANFVDADKRQLRLDLGLRLDPTKWTVRGRLQRRKVPSGAGSISRTISLRERDIAARVLTAISDTLGPANADDGTSLNALRPSFDERIVGEHLSHYHRLEFDLSEWLVALRQLAEQTYENKALAFGCVIDPNNRTEPEKGARFPRDFLHRDRKKYRALSDGYRTSYRVSGKGALLGFFELGRTGAQGSRYYPEWCEDFATEARGGKIGLALTRQGDVLVLDDGHLTFTYRFGRWQYWNHAHLVDLIRNAARVQKVPPNLLSHVVRAVYRAALDVSFRRSGGLFVLLRRRKSLRQIVRSGEAIDDYKRDPLDAVFDRAVAPVKVQALPRSVLAELASLDGAVVLGNKGDLLAYGAILEPKKKGRITGTEGSRSKAAIGASKFGLSVKVSSDGDITVYHAGEKLITV